MTDRKSTFRVTKDGGHNWGDWRERDLGAQGEYGKRVIVNRLGQARTMSIAIRVTSPIKAAILGATAHSTPLER